MSFKKSIGDSVVSGNFDGLDKLMNGLKSNYYVDIGILGDNIGMEGEITIAGIGAVHEFGAKITVTPKMRGWLAFNGLHLKASTTVITIPERSFIRSPLEKGASKIQKQIEPKMPEYLEKGDIKGLFKLLGLAVENVIQEAFESGNDGEWPPLHDFTKERKGSDSILIDIGSLRKSISSKVGKGSK